MRPFGEKEPHAGDKTQELRLIARLRAADRNAWEEFERRFGGRMHLVARRFLRSEEDLTDAVQDCYVSALQGIGKFEGRSTIGTWLHRIVVNACLMKLRTRRRGARISIEELLSQFDESGHRGRSIRRRNNPPDERLTREETRSLVRSCIDRLPDDYRKVLMLRDIEELSTDEAATALGAAPGTVKTRLHRARQALRGLLEPHLL